MPVACLYTNMLEDCFLIRGDQVSEEQDRKPCEVEKEGELSDDSNICKGPGAGGGVVMIQERKVLGG